MTQPQSDKSQGFLVGVRVLEVADEKGEYCGWLLAGLGADVIKIEPPGGNETRHYGPFYQDQPHPERSLYFWHYNFGKRGITLDLEGEEGRRQFRELVKRSDVVLDTRPRGYLEGLGLGYEALKQINPGIVVSRMSPFGDTGPWADYKGSDLVHLGLGGIMLNCGYDPDPSGRYETPPIAPQMWQAYHIAGEMTTMGIMGALYYRNTTGNGQSLSTAIHEAVSKQTEGDLPDWVYARLPHFRKTCRGSSFNPSPPNIGMTKDGRYLLPTFITAGGGGTFERTVELLDKYGLADDLKDEMYKDEAYRDQRDVNYHIYDVVHRFVGKFLFQREICREAQDRAIVWAPLRKPEENLTDPHWRQHRETFIEVEHPELGKKFTYVGAKWMSPEVPWRKGSRSPLIGEHNQEVLGMLEQEPPRTYTPKAAPAQLQHSKHGKPFALSGLRMVDLTWLLASGGAGRSVTSQGVNAIKVEYKYRWDFIRWGTSSPPPGGRAERDKATGPILQPRSENPNRSGFFNEINAGKRDISLNLNTPRGKEILTQLLKDADIVAEGFTPGMMDRWGFGYEQLKKINPSIIYVQQSGMGQIGIYGRARSYGPIAASFSGISEMSGLPEPYPPAGIGYSYLDWFGANNLSMAILAALYRKQVTGKGSYIDSSQVESGTYLNGTAILDYTANGRPWRRYGNRSPFKPGAPHGAYRCQGEDRWVTIACFTEEEWRGFAKVVGNPAWSQDSKFATLEGRLANQDELDALVSSVTEGLDPYVLMHALQGAGVAAGVCQTAGDRYDHDPQLKHLEWLVELTQSEIGTWPVKEFPVKFSETPTHMGGIIDRHGPCYGEDNEYVYSEVVGLSKEEIRELERQEVI